jgi:hypothetical protein
LFTANPTWTDLGTSPGLHVENSATKCLSYGMAHKIMIFIKRHIQDARKIIPYVFELDISSRIKMKVAPLGETH